jgi:hypothetical protein
MEKGFQKSDTKKNKTIGVDRGRKKKNGEPKKKPNLEF